MTIRFDRLKTNGLLQEAMMASLVVILAFLLGYAAGSVAAFLHGAALAYLAWHLFQFHRLRVWLHKPEDTRFIGIWRELSSDMRKRLGEGGARSRHRRKPRLNWIVKKFNKSVPRLFDAAVLLNQHDEIEWWNTAASQLLGIGETDDRGKRITHLMRHPEFTERLEKEKDWQEPLEAPSPVQPAIWLTILVVPAGKNKRLLQARDSTRLHRLEQIRRDFVANASHELRTPLTVINGYVETLLGRDDAKALPWYPVLPRIHQQTERMGKIVADLLLLSGLESGKEQNRRERVCVTAMLETIRDEALTLGADVCQSIEIDAGSRSGIIGNPSELHSAFSNLVFNAVRYTAPDGNIIVRWHFDDRGGHLLVRDTGIGIEARHLSRITERFYRVDTGRSRETGGTGLGLTIVKHVLRQHGADLSIESVPGKGSDFTCHFPPARLFEAGDGEAAAS